MNFDQFESLFIMRHHIHNVPKSLKLKIDKFRNYLLNKKQIGLVSKLGFDFVHDYLKIRVLHGFVCVWKVVAKFLKIMASLACEEKRIQVWKIKALLSMCSH